MKLKFAFARKVAVGLIAIGSLACIATDTFAANRTWTSSNVTSASYNQKWGTSFTSNWAGNTVPTTADVATFGTNAFNKYSIFVQPGTEVGGLQFNSTGANTYTFGTNGLTIGSSGIVNNSGRQQTLGQTTTLSANQTWQGTSGSITTNIVDLNGKTLTTSTEVVINQLNDGPGTLSPVNVTGGSLSVWGGNKTDKINFTVSGGYLTTNDPSVGANFNSSLSDLTLSGGTYYNSKVGGPGGQTNWDAVTMSAGGVDMMNVDGSLSVNSYTQTGGTVKQYVGGVGENSTIQSTDGAGHATGPLSYGGGLTIDMAAAGSQAFAIGTTWNLFQGVNAGGAAASNFSTALLDNVDAGSPYAGLSFTKYGTEFSTAPGKDGTWLVFQAQSGNLVVVPEPSTIVFAGLGVAMSGWTMWKKRRLSKLLAAKVG